MAAAIVALLVLSSSMKSSFATTTTTTTKCSNTNYIRSCCSSTRYPNLCYSSLSPYASTVGTNRTKLAIVALKVSLHATQNTSALVKKLSNTNGLLINETNAIKDCVYEVGDAICELKQSIEEMKVLRGSDFEFKLSSVETWVSAALTDEDTCMEGMGGYGNGKLEKSIRNSVTNTAMLTSNALAIVDGLAQNYKSKSKAHSPSTRS
ncbi:21 kDa protein-like [Telopea speciosissima]|uniref:21 kDa protein-like n=1 Tax=Telopea speciosissima TaxID=54955 RepID=UPI001CC71919|nr:21 kDa protein-like [Telopea speciosissima]